MNKIFGVGFSKTGTTSMEDAFDILGYNVCRGHYNNNLTNYLVALYVNKDYEEIRSITNYFDAFFDGPWGGGGLYMKLYEFYPEAGFILSVRNKEDWYISFEKMLMKFTDDIDDAFDSFHRNGRYGTRYFFQNIFGVTTLKGNKQKIIDYYENYNESVIEFFEKKNKPLLIEDFTESIDPWLSLCNYLNIEKPLIDFPHSNVGVVNTINKEETKRKSFLKRFLGK